MKHTPTVVLMIALLAGTVLAQQNVAREPVDASGETQAALAGIGRTLTWETLVSPSSTVDLWASAPVEVDANIRARTRFIYVQHDDTVGDASTSAVCVRLGPATDTPAMTCQRTLSTGLPLRGVGASFTYQVRPVFPFRTIASEGHVPLWARADSSNATPVSVLVTVTIGW